MHTTDRDRRYLAPLPPAMAGSGGKLVNQWIFPDTPPPDSKRNLAGTEDRKTPGYKRADSAYNRIQNIMERWRRPRTPGRKRGLAFSPRYQDLTGCRDLREFLRAHQREFWRIAKRLGLRSIASLKLHYGRNGWRAWSWDHLTLREHDTATESGLAAATHYRNLRPMIAGENHYRKPPVENPLQNQFQWK